MTNLIGPAIYVTGLVLVTFGSVFLASPDWLGAGTYPLAFLFALLVNGWMSVAWPAARFRETRRDYLQAIPVALCAWLLSYAYGMSTEHAAGLLGVWLLPTASPWITDGMQYAFALLFYFLLYEGITYLQHYLEHQVGPLWKRMHSLHHEPRFFGFALVLRVHYLEYLFMHLTRTLPLLLLQVDPTIITAVMSIHTYGNIVAHSSTQLSFAPIAKLFNTPDVHIWHHDPGARVNYGAGVLAIFDRIAGTYFYGGPSTRPAAQGIDGVETLRGGFDMLVLRPAHVTPDPKATNP